MSTSVLMCMHVPIYRKPAQNPNYFLDGFYRVTATIDKKAPLSHVWASLKNLEQAPAVLFCAGDKVTYRRLKPSDDAYETRNASFEREYDRVRGFVSVTGAWYADFHSSIVFVDKGLLCTASVADVPQTFPSLVPGAFMHEQLRREAGRQFTVYCKLRDSVQFLDVYRGEVLTCHRLEKGHVGEKRKRNMCVGME